ncbi:hypothetical protein PSAB_19610 [Paenibacillus sabinae T27]|uniref:Uncharacterized protein n=1 Tax=Paenibacillus sabinae T27 TaxID=1268072 RepID=X4ZQS9_9BACL|nr:hypothetical protein PSAB_19610 [Paenibacillus sabinae T27]
MSSSAKYSFFNIRINISTRNVLASFKDAVRRFFLKIENPDGRLCCVKQQLSLFLYNFEKKPGRNRCLYFNNEME